MAEVTHSTQSKMSDRDLLRQQDQALRYADEKIRRLQRVDLRRRELEHELSRRTNVRRAATDLLDSMTNGVASVSSALSFAVKHIARSIAVRIAGELE